MVDGGATMHTQVLEAGPADELHPVLAPFFVADSRAPRFVAGGPCRHPDHRARPAEVREMGDVVLLRCALSERFGTP